MRGTHNMSEFYKHQIIKVTRAALYHTRVNIYTHKYSNTQTKHTKKNQIKSKQANVKTSREMKTPHNIHAIITELRHIHTRGLNAPKMLCAENACGGYI